MCEVDDPSTVGTKVMSPRVAWTSGLNDVDCEVISPTLRKRKNMKVQADAILVASLWSNSSIRSEVAASTKSLSMCRVIGVRLVSSTVSALFIPRMQQ